MRKPNRVMVIVVVLAVVAAGVATVVATRLGTGSSSTQAPVSAAHGGSVSLGDATLTAGPGAVSGTGQLVATQGGAPSARTGPGALAARPRPSGSL